MLSDIIHEEIEADFPESPFFFQMMTSKPEKQTKIVQAWSYPLYI